MEVPLDGTLTVAHQEVPLQGSPFRPGAAVLAQFEPEDDGNGALSLNSNSTIKGSSFHLNMKIMGNGDCPPREAAKKMKKVSFPSDETLQITGEWGSPQFKHNHR